ncbi:MAG: amidohydrolase [Vicinamibacterales bacterium]|nr:amidohydrolase [Vicinamibacterales bacterium]MDP7472390.1 amidohydrolase [Vicinamibacterales bacterium]MDP7670414.1 amidohydrolase [Vicinamibacterales bacterium]HJO38072.1 amidohydrolase [Vicinamibacterales bacterium]|tara:strand:+ start:178 stop:1476 length:1299 start_codon:yes stop_codon:yes gene_type:complete
MAVNGIGGAICLLAVAPWLAVSAAAQDAAIDEAVDRYAEQIIEIRHQIHQNPELGNREFETAALVAEHLRELDFDEVSVDVAHTGVVAILRGGLPGDVVAVRADMDALPVTEDTSYPFASTVRTEYLGQQVGVMHACGHDVHTAVQLGVASVLASMRDRIPGTIKFIFQPAEEGPPPGEEGGAALMVQGGVLANPRPSAVFGLHTLASMEVGRLGFKAGPMLAAVDHFKIRVTGQQAHGAYPHLGIDPIVMASQIVTAFQTIRSRNLSPLEPSVVTVGLMQGGTRFNIIPAEVWMEGTVRTYDPGARDTIERRMSEILEGITIAGGGSYALEYDRGSPATINDAELTAQMAPTLERVVGPDNVDIVEPVMGGEDFSFFANEVPGFFFRLGMVRPGTESGGHHTPTFQADDASVPVGIRAMSNLLLDYLVSRQ